MPAKHTNAGFAGGADEEPKKPMMMLHAIASLKLTLIILAIFAVAIAVATFIEVDYGPAGARALVYAAWWFEALLALLVVNLVASLIVNFPYRVTQIGFVMTHIGFIVVLIAGGITRFYGYEGNLSIREGASSDQLYSVNDHVHLTVGDQTASFPVNLYKSGETNISHELTVGGEKFRVTVEEFWRHAGRQLVSAPGGDPTIVFRVGGANPPRLEGLKIGNTFDAGGVTLHFLEDGSDVPPATSPRGELIVEIGETLHPISVPAEFPSETKIDGYSVRILEFATDFRVGSESSTEGDLLNPAIRVEVQDPEGKVGQKLLFAYHPEFDAGHMGGEEAHVDIPLAYKVTRDIYAFPEDGEVALRASFALSLSLKDAQTKEVGERVPAGEQFLLAKDLLLRSAGSALLLVDYWESAVDKMVASDNEGARSAIRVAVQDGAGNRAEATIQRWTDEGHLDLGARHLDVNYRPRQITLPYELHLDDFVLKTYPGSNNPASFESLVKIHDEERGVHGRPARIYMNHPLTYRGFKHFQSSYDKDRLGTVLSVNHDPGKLPTYLGYILVGAGFLITLTRRFWYRGPGNRVKEAATRAKKAMATMFLGGLALALAYPGPAGAQDAEDPHAGHSHNQAQAEPLAKNFLTPEARKVLQTLMIQDFQGRMKPFDTLGRESSMKITKRFSFNGWEPTDMYLSWMIQPRPWFERPLLAVRHPGLKEILGVSSSTTHVSTMSLSDGSGRYRLAPNVDHVHRKPAKERSKAENKLLSFDDRLNMFDLIVRQMAFRVFPVPNDENNRWLAPAELNEETAALLGDEVFGKCQAAWVMLVDGVLDQDNQTIIRGAQAIGDLQLAYGSHVIPSSTVLQSEMLLNRLQPFTWVTLPYLFAFMLLMGAYARNLIRNVNRPCTWREPLYAVGMVIFLGSVVFHLAAYALRWVASGRAPLSNGYESLLFIAAMIAVAGLYYELRGRRGSIAALSGLLTAVILGVAMLPGFDPAISPLQPVLASYWLIIHVTIITASYGFLGLSAMISMAMLAMYVFKRPGRQHLHMAILDLHGLNWSVMITGLAFLSVGTFLGGVWANESWGRYWGWDPKETWSLVTILVYAFAVHLRFVPSLANPLNIATASFLSILSVGMTYFGVNYFLAGLHSYAEGSAPGVPGWVYGMVAGMLVLTIAAHFTDAKHRWHGSSPQKAPGNRPVVDPDSA